MKGFSYKCVWMSWCPNIQRWRIHSPEPPARDVEFLFFKTDFPNTVFFSSPVLRWHEWCMGMSQKDTKGRMSPNPQSTGSVFWQETRGIPLYSMFILSEISFSFKDVFFSLLAFRGKKSPHWLQHLPTLWELEISHLYDMSHIDDVNDPDITDHQE